MKTGYSGQRGYKLQAGRQIQGRAGGEKAWAMKQKQPSTGKLWEWKCRI